ncbi:Transmembrane protein [Globisporangium polare]
MVERARCCWRRQLALKIARVLTFVFLFFAAAGTTTTTAVQAASEAALVDAHICASAEFSLLPPEPFGSSPLTAKTLIKGDQVCLEFALSSAVPYDAEWVAVGLSRAGKMVSSPITNVMVFQIYMGSLEAYELGGYYPSAVVRASNQSGFIVSAVSVSARSFQYQRALRAATATDVRIDLKKSMNFIWAYGTSWPITGHKPGTKGSVKYRFRPEVVTPAPVLPVLTAPPATAPPTTAPPPTDPPATAPPPTEPPVTPTEAPETTPPPDATAPATMEVPVNPGETSAQPSLPVFAPINADADANASLDTNSSASTPEPIATVVTTINETFTVQPTTSKPNVTGDATLSSDDNQGPIFRISGPFCGDGSNCPAVVGGTTFLFVSLCGLLTTWALYGTSVGRLLLHHTLVGPPVKSTTTSRCSINPWTMLMQTLADLKVGEALVVLTFLGAVASLVVLNLNAQESAQVITGQVALLTLMFLLLPVSRIPMWSIFFGSSFERIVKFHRWLGVAMTVAVIVHLVQVLQVTSVLHSEKFGEVVPLYGFIACVSFLSMAPLANEFIRRKAYELFYISHRVLAPVGLVFTILHAPTMVGLALAVPLGLYVLGLLIQWTLSAASTFQANISSVNHHQTATLILRQNIQTEKLALLTGPGSFFWVKLPSVSRTQWHPFSAIVTANGKSVGFCVKAMGEGTFTRKLVDEALKKHVVPVSLCGPFGKLSLDVDRYDVVLVVAGGVGITPMVSLINQKRLRITESGGKKSKSQEKKQQEWLVVWSVQSSDHLLMIDDFMPSQQQEASASTDTSSSSSNIHDSERPPIEPGEITVVAADTTTPEPRPEEALQVSWAFHVSTAKSDGYLTRQSGEKLVYKAGRPLLSQVISNSEGSRLKAGGRVAVLACGPPAMTTEAQALARACHFDFHKEVFSW